MATDPIGNNGNAEPSTGAGVLNDVWDAQRHILRTSDGITTAMALAKQITYSANANQGDIGTVPLFTVTGDILCTLVGYVNTSLTGASATIAHGVSGNTGGLIAQLTATTIVTPKGIDSTGLVAAGTGLNRTPLFALFSQNIIATVATANLTGGVIDYILYWVPLTVGATVV